MVAFKELISDLGGGRSLSLGALLLLLLYVGASRYLVQQEQTDKDLWSAIHKLEDRQNRDEIYHGNDPRFTVEKGKTLVRWLERLERRLEYAEHRMSGDE